ncbi:DNA-processing protein DprA [Rufibacter roseus]|uniref:DNA-processing protein DprA n=1 Tax=Rufibacter roseus TaxID=1567108 RepID=A0ABW2DN10_9BACT|nr:DNA-processing protein DprA [Rufibacter roseus]
MTKQKPVISVAQLLLLENLAGIGPAAINAIIAYLDRGVTFPATDDGVVKLLKEVKKYYPRLKLATLDAVAKARKKSEQFMQRSEANGVKIISYLEEGYPSMMIFLPDKPLLLHFKGNLAALENPAVAVVGTREPSAYTKMEGRRFSESVAEAGFAIVSGLALGCDTIAHEAALEHGKPTIAVMAGGLHAIYPNENVALANRIVEAGGLLISECSFGTNPSRSSFKLRKRIQTGLSRGVVVLETGLTGGTRHTVDYALKQKKSLACLCPTQANETSETAFAGNKALIQQKGVSRLDSQAAVENFLSSLLG